MATGRKSLKDKMRTAMLTERIDVAGPEVAIFKFRPMDGELFQFKAGQYATLGLDVGDEFIPRAYSIASSPHTRDYLELYINVINEGQLTPSIFKLRVGDEVYYMGPKGIFTLEKTETKRLLFVATGTGLAPYVSILRMLHDEQAAGRPQERSITLVHGARYTADLGYRWDLDGIARHQSLDFMYLPMVSRPEQDQFWTPETGRGRVTELLKILGEDSVDAATPALAQDVDPQAVLQRLPRESTAVFLCGNPDMITDVKELLQLKGFSEIYTEEYW
ncbi:MAG: hypothetical protein IH959_08125 [Chloroflexi bacterium]|nr:hypothetical protein [Chloroflexota bacterium]